MLQLYKQYFVFLLFIVRLNGFDAINPRIYDCFTFFNELDLLELKLHELADHVDKFVIVESTVTFQGVPKPLYFSENKQRFEKFLDKIIHIVVDDAPISNCAWHREAHQRNQIVRGLVDCADHDIIIVEDLDEIIRPSVLPEIAAILKDPRIVVSCDQDLYAFYMDYYCCPWSGSVAACYSFLKNRFPEQMRELRNNPNVCHVAKAGWHFSWIGGVDQVILKLQSFSHTEYNNSWETDPKNVEALLHYQSTTAFGNHFRAISGNRRVVPVTADVFPRYLVENLSTFAEKGYLSSK